MINPRETDERGYLEHVEDKLKIALGQVIWQIEKYAKEILEIKRYLYENLAQFDAAEKAANRIAVSDNVTFGQKAVKEREQLQKLILSPYFGRIDFAEADKIGEAFYIGVHSFVDPTSSQHLIFDWRAPISSMFYDFETGPAFYLAPMGRIDGMLSLKRQYRIKQGQMDYMIESAVNIGDEILQKELSQKSDDKMKNIVATIQKEQNAIIRNEAARVLIIQGAAGSGKTSIALHRIAFLLYRYKGTLSSKNILILSPNKVFGNYISNVLPELGEENISEIGVDELAGALLGKKYKHQSFAQQVEDLLTHQDQQKIARISFKATNLFVDGLQSYLDYADQEYFTPSDLKIGAFFASSEELRTSYHALKRLPIKPRLYQMAENLMDKYKRNYNTRLDASTARQIRSSIQSMFRFNDPLALYQDFYRYIAEQDMFRLAGKNTLECCDVYPFLYTKLYFEGVEADYRDIQHLLVDEMQDYTPIQYAVLAKLFDCKMTILGDRYQSVNPYSSSSVEKIQPYFAGCVLMELCRSYRSTIEITAFTQRILENKKLIPIERHGELPTVTVCKTEAEELEKIRALMEEFRQSAFASLGIVCRSQTQARQLYDKLRTAYDHLSLLDFGSSEFRDGMVITSVHMSKGLEFDQVIVPGASDDLYQTQLDRSLLYIACTRAMHRLDITCYGSQTKLLQ